MRAKRWALTTALSAALLTAPVPPSVDLLPGPGSAEIIGVGVVEAQSTKKCKITICFDVDLILIEVEVCFEQEFDC